MMQSRVRSNDKQTRTERVRLESCNGCQTYTSRVSFFYIFMVIMLD